MDILIEGSFDPDSLQFLSQIQELFEESRFPYKVDLVKESDLVESYKADVFSSRIQIG